MKYFIFPTNYNRKEKFLGMLDYKIISIIAVWGAIVFFILKAASCGTLMKIYLFLFVFGMPSILMLVGFNGENMADVLRYLLRYLISPKAYIYKKREEEK